MILDDTITYISCENHPLTFIPLYAYGIFKQVDDIGALETSYFANF